MDLFRDLVNTQEALERTIKTLGVPFADPFNEEATISQVNDPEGEGRVKVIFKRDGVESDWLYVSGSGSGRISSQYIGARCTVVKIGGNAAAGIVTSIYSNGSGNPVQIPVIQEQLFSRSNDPGLQCNEENRGRVYVVSNEFGQDLVICRRRNSTQRDGADNPVWSWNSLTHNEWIEKGFDPGAADEPVVLPLYKSNPGIPKCTKDLAGEIHSFSEDRAYRSFLIECKRDENGKYGWAPVSSTPTFFRTTLPNCTESIHGMNALIDTGRESEFVVCQRYSGSMKWVKQGRREPMQFFDQDLPPRKSEWIQKMNSIPLLNVPSPADKSLARGFEDLVMMEALMAISPVGTDPFLRTLLDAANALPGAFDSATTWSNVAKTLIVNKGTLPVESLISQLSTVFKEGGDISSGTSEVLSRLGGVADILVSGVRTNNTSEALQTIGKKALTEAIASFSPQLAGVYYGYTIGGALGAIDTAVAVGLDVLPPTLGQIMSPIALIGEAALKKQPISYGTIIDAAVSGGLVDAVASIVQGKGDFSSFNFDSLLSSASQGRFGTIAQTISDFRNLSSITKLGLSDLPLTATTALGLLKLGSGFADFLGPGGLGLKKASEFLDNANVVSGLISSISSLLPIKSGCPCDPSCRKTEHGVDSDGSNLLDKCGALPAIGRTVSSVTSNPLDINTGVIAVAKGLLPTGVGEILEVGTGLDLSGLLKTGKLANLPDTVWHAKDLDQPEFNADLAYSFESVQKALQLADNNITKVESVNRKLIDASYGILSSVLDVEVTGVKGVQPAIGSLNKLMEIVKQNSEAIKDLYKFTKSLDTRKDGPRAPVVPTSAITNSIRSIKELVSLNSLTKKEAQKILNNNVLRADKEWRSLSPGLDKLNLSDVILGGASPDVPLTFEPEDMGTKFDKNRVLSISLASQLNNTTPQPNSLTQRLFSDTPEAQTIFEEIKDSNKGEPIC
jgi:hypothetical protein